MAGNFIGGLARKKGRKEIKENRERWRSEGPLLFFLD